jgi:hypothetical protein
VGVARVVGVGAKKRNLVVLGEEGEGGIGAGAKAQLGFELIQTQRTQKSMSRA